MKKDRTTESRRTLSRQPGLLSKSIFKIWILQLLLNLILTAAAGICINRSRTVPADRHTSVFLILVMAACWAVFIFLTLSGYRKTLRPLRRIEALVHGARDDMKISGNIEIEKSSRIGRLYQEIERLEDTMREMADNEARAIFMRKQAELSVLQSQINPHFLYNTLETIRGQAIVYGISDIEIMTRALANLFRYSINSKGVMVPLSQELNNVENYFLIQQCRFGDKYSKIEEVDEDTRDCLVPKLIIQPLVENAVHHGLETKTGRGKLTITAYRTSKDLIIHIVDDGVGIAKEKLEKLRATLSDPDREEPESNERGHIGIINVHDRIRLAYGEPYGLQIFSGKGVGTDVEVTLPVILNS